MNFTTFAQSYGNDHNSLTRVPNDANLDDCSRARDQREQGGFSAVEVVLAPAGDSAIPNTPERETKGSGGVGCPLVADAGRRRDDWRTIGRRDAWRN
ncbi:hypothetical protein LXL04_029135 [Taraxacum kok-saghyz]